MSRAPAFAAPSRSATSVAAAGRLVRVGDGRDEDRADPVGGARLPWPAPCRRRRRPCRRRTRRPPRYRRSTMPERSRIHSSEESMCSHDLVVGDDALPAGRRRRRGSGCRGAGVAGCARSCGTASGCSRTIGWPGDDRVAVLDEPLHDGAAVGRRDHGARRAGSRTSRPCRRAGAPRPAACARGCGTCPCRGRRAGARSAGGTSGWRWRAARRGPRRRARSSGVCSARVSTPGSARLASPVSVPAGGSSMHRRDPDVGHRVQAAGPSGPARPPATRAAGAPRGRRGPPSRRRWTAAACAGHGWRSSGRGARGHRRRGPCAGCGRLRRPRAGAAATSRAGRRRGRRGASRVPAATIWPAPFTLAAVSP